jgi:hypothetical protein
MMRDSTRDAFNATDTAIVTRDELALDALVERARALVITNADDYRLVADFVLGLKDLRARINATFDEHIRRAYQTHRGLCDEKRAAESQAIEAEAIAKQLLVAYDTQLQRAIDDERARRDAEQQLQNAKLEEAATRAESHGDYVEADALRQQQSTMPVLVEVERPRAEGISFRETWSARVVDFDALVVAAASHKPYRALLLPDMRSLHAQAKSLKSRLAIPGVEAVRDKNVSARR